MNKLLILLTFLSISFGSFAQVQELWSTATQGGEHFKGAVFKVDSSGGNFEIIHSFKAFDGAFPYNNRLIDLNDGFLYGVTGGAIFKVDKESKEIIRLLEFGIPSGSLTLTSDGRIIGFDVSLGSRIIEYHVHSNKLDTLHEFAYSNTLGNTRPQGDLVEVSPNKFIGTSSIGGFWNNGYTFEFDLTNSKVSRLRDFQHFSYQLGGSFMKAKNGKLYGVFADLFEYDPITGNFTVLKLNYGSTSNSFQELDSEWLYVTTISSLKRYNYITNTDEILVSFTSQGEGGIIQANNNKIYGTRYDQIYEYDITRDSLTIKKVFTSANDQPRLAGSFFHELDSGEMLSFSIKGGRNDVGTMFSYNYLNDSLQVLNQFTYGEDGEQPYLLMSHSNGKMYGVTKFGGKFNRGVLFEVDIKLNNFQKLYDYPYFVENLGITELNDSILLVVNGNKFSSADSNLGVFEFNLNSRNAKRVVVFDTISGYFPQGKLISKDKINFYGKMDIGGSFGKGTIFKYNSILKTINTIHDFDSLSGGVGLNGIEFLNDSIIAGNLISAGSNFKGVLYQINLNSSKFEIIYDFNPNQTINNPISPLTINGNSIYGVTTDFTRNAPRILYEFEYSTKTFISLHQFKYGQGVKEYPNGGVYLNKNNRLMVSFNSIGNNNGTSVFSGIYQFNLNNNSIVQTYFGGYGKDVDVINSPFIPVKVCREPLVAVIVSDSITICSNVNLANLVTFESRLNSANNWKFYNSVGDSFPNSQIAEFNFLPTQSGFYYIESEGGCVQNQVKDSVFVAVKPDAAYYLYDTLTICRNSEYISTNGDTIKQLSRTTLFSDLNESSAGCDSNLYTLVNVIPDIAIKDSLGYLISNQKSAVYQWVNCGTNELIIGETNQIFIPKKSGIYRVDIDFKSCTAQSFCIQADAVGLPENPFQSQLNYYPNPTNGIVQIEFTEKQGNIEVEVYSIQGRLVQTESFTNQNSFELDLNQTSGIYFIQLTNEKGEQANLKVVKR